LHNETFVILLYILAAYNGDKFLQLQKLTKIP